MRVSVYATLVCFLIVFTAFSSCILLWNEVLAQTQVKEMNFYFHYSPQAVQIGGTSSNLIINTLYQFQGGVQNFYKAVGQPKISEDFYLYPSLAGNLTLSGDWIVTIFANSTALHPATWNVEFWEKTPNGSVVWDSGVLSPQVIGGPAGYQGYVDVPIYGYALRVTNLTHSFNQGDTLQVEVTVNTGSTVPLRLWYNSISYPSGLTLPSAGYASPYSIITLDANGTATRVFYTYWSQNQMKVIIDAYVSDPFGGYDIGNVIVQIKDPTGFVIENNVSMTRINGDNFSYVSIYQYTFTYTSNFTLGRYDILVSVIDNNGLHHYQVYGTYQPFIQSMSSFFSLGLSIPVIFQLLSASGPLNGADIEIYSGGHLYASGLTNSTGSANITVFSGVFEVKVYWEGTLVYDNYIIISNSSKVTLPVYVFDPVFKFTTYDGSALNNAIVFVTYPNGTTGRNPLITDPNGEIQLHSVPAGNYSMLVLYDDKVVADTTLLANFSWSSSGNGYIPEIMQEPAIKSNVYTLVVNVLDNSGHALTNASVLITSKANNAVFDFAFTKNGTATFLLPSGSYNIRSEYHNVLWLSYYSNTTVIPVQITGDKSVTITMTNIPPPLWSTVGFWLIVAIILVVAIALVIYFKRK